MALSIATQLGHNLEDEEAESWDSSQKQISSSKPASSDPLLLASPQFQEFHNQHKQHTSWEPSVQIVKGTFPIQAIIGGVLFRVSIAVRRYYEHGNSYKESTFNCGGLHFTEG